jgi:tetratricopeptide (TPR) repeat protein
MHDGGNYKEALDKYRQALKIDSASGLVFYEMAYTYLAMEKYDEAATYSRKVIASGSRQQQGAYLLLGSALDMGGKPLDAIRIYQEGISRFPGVHQLHYNLALAYFNADNMQKAEEVCTKSITMKPAHISSHILMSKIMQNRGYRLRSLLPLYYVLYLDPQSEKAPEVYGLLREMLAVGGIRGEGGQPDIHRYQDQDSVFNTLEQKLSAILDTNNTNGSDEAFADMNCRFFSLLGPLKSASKKVWSDMYCSLFADLAESGHCEAFAYHISRTAGRQSISSWLTIHQNKVQMLQSWLNSHAPAAVQRR